MSDIEIIQAANEDEDEPEEKSYVPQLSTIGELFSL